MKKCAACHEEKLLDAFSLGGKRKMADGTVKRYCLSYCKPCMVERNRKYRAKHSGRRQAAYATANKAARERYAKSPEKHRKKNRDWYKANRQKSLESSKKWRDENRFSHALAHIAFDATRKGYAHCIASPKEIESAFTGVCHNCGIEENGRKLCVDHNHITGAFRGWLCCKCNLADALTTDKKGK
jgi:hypothetical protein